MYYNINVFNSTRYLRDTLTQSAMLILLYSLMWCGCDTPPIPINELEFDSSVGGIGLVTLAGDDEGGEALNPLGGSLIIGEAGAESGGEAGAESGGEAGAESGGEAGAESGGEAGAESGGEAGAESGGEAGAESGEEAGEVVDLWERSECEADPTPLEMNATDLASQALSATWNIGGALGADALLVIPRSDRDIDLYYVISLIGGRIELRDESGRLIWQRVLPDVIALRGVYDFDGDGTLEVLMNTRRRAYILSVASGVTRWRSEPEFGEDLPTLTSISRVIVERAPPIDLPQLYLTDTGCSTAGTGYGMVYDFSSGFDETRAQPISSPRIAGRCARWHTLSRRAPDATLESDGEEVQENQRTERLEVMLTDARGLHAFNAATGARTLCGHIEGMPPVSALPYRRSKTPTGYGWVASLPDQIMLLTPTPNDQESDAALPAWCETGEPVLRARWSLERVFDPLGLTLIDYNGDGFDDIWVNTLSVGAEVDENPTPPRRVAELIDGASGRVIARIFDIAILGMYQTYVTDAGEGTGVGADLLIAENPDPEQALSQSLLTLQLARFIVPSSPGAPTELVEPVMFDPPRLWTESVVGARPVWMPARVTDTSEYRRLTLLDGAQSKGVLLRRDQRLIPALEMSAIQSVDTPVELLLIDAMGERQRFATSESWGALRTLCPQVGPCELPSRLALSLAGGQVELLETRDLSPLGIAEQIQAPTGKVSVRISAQIIDADSTGEIERGSSHLITQSSSGELNAYLIPNDAPLPESASAAWLWSRPASQWGRDDSDFPTRPIIAEPPHAPGESTSLSTRTVVTYDRRNPRLSAWVGYDLMSGVERWRHSLSSVDWRTEEQTLPARLNLNGVVHDVIFRLERALTPDAIATLELCEGGERVYTDEELSAPHPSCPEITPTPRVIHALDGSDGRCLWRTIMRERRGCARPSLQHLSLTDIDEDGEPELYLTESDSIRRLDPKTGALEGTGVIPRRPDGRFVAGGWIKSYQGSLLRFGTYSPPDLYQAIPLLEPEETPPELAVTWFGASVAGLRNQSWLARWAALTEMGVWLTLGIGYPLALFDARGEISALRQLALSETDGVEVRSLEVDDYFAESPQITSLRELTERELTRGEIIGPLMSEGLIATTREGGLFALDAAGTLVWGKRFSATPSLPEVVDWDQDGKLEWLITTADGALRFYDQRGYLGVTALWEGRCDVVSSCEPAEDIDLLRLGESLCVGWVPLIGVEEVELQIQTERGTPITAWEPPEFVGRTLWRASELSQLTPQNSYRVAIRGWITDSAGQRVYTAETYSDGFFTADDKAPSATLTLDRSLITVSAFGADPALSIELDALDDLALAGWSLVIYNEEGRFIRALNASSVSTRTLRRIETWSGLDRFGQVVPAGRYQILFGVTDSAGNQTNASAWVEVDSPE